MLLPLLAGLLVSVTSCQAPDPAPDLELGDELAALVAPASMNVAHDVSPSEEMRARRRALAQSGRHLYEPGSIGTSAATAQELVAALDVPAAFVRSATLVGPDVSTQVFAQWGTKIHPRNGGSLAVLSTGVLGITPEPGTDLSPGDEAGDSVTLRIELEVPRGFNRLSFDYNFLSTESPDFKNIGFNDSFTATLIPPAGPAQEIVLASVNTSNFVDASDELADGTGYDIFTDDPADVDDFFPGGLPDAGITGFQTHRFDLAASGRFTLVLDIRDLGDDLLDSAVVIDNLHLSFMETLDVNVPGLITADGISEDPAVLLAANKQVRGVVADGVTQLLLRTRLPGPGQVEYELLGGAAPADGTIATLNEGRVASRVTMTAQETAPGEFHAFAAYTAPVGFNRGGDGALATRTVTVRARFTPTDLTQPALEDVHQLTIHRPPVVFVHGLWDRKVAWNMPILADQRFTVEQADYDSSRQLSTSAQTVPSTAILNALTAMRNNQIAATQVDIVAHSIGGILVRQHLGKDGYRNVENFRQGDVHKLITLNTPHHGTPLANAIMRFWTSLTTPQQNQRRPVLNVQKTLVDQGAINDIRTDSPVIAALRASGVPSHAIVSTGGRPIPRDNDSIVGNDIVDSPALLAVAKPTVLLSNFVEREHPDTKNLPAAEQIKFIFGNESRVFAGDHDMFVNVDSQSGGIRALAVTSVPIHFTSQNNKNFESAHFRALRSQAYSARIVELLNTPVTSTLFGEFPAAPDAAMASTPTPAPATTDDFEQMDEIEPDGLTIVSPTSGTRVTPGTSVQVTVAPDPGIELALLGVITQNDAVTIEHSLGGQAQVRVNMPIAAESAGPVELLAFGFDTQGNFLISNLVLLQAATNARLLSMRILERSPFLFGIGARQQVTVTGRYDDGIERELHPRPPRAPRT